MFISIEQIDNLELLNKTINNRLKGVDGKNFQIQCEAKGGRPPPFLTIKVRNQDVAQGNQSVVHTIKTIPRYFDNATVECVAKNSDLNKSLLTEAYIYLSLKPLAPVFDRDSVILKETESLKISCTSTGSRPAALFNWFMEDKNITFYSTQTFAYEVTTDTWTITSVLTYTVVRQNNGQLITCVASNEADHIGISDSQWIQVQFSPKIYVSNMTFNQLEKLRVISCNASGNPSNYTYYQWKHTSVNGKLIREMKGKRNGKLELPLSDTDNSYQDNGIYVCKAGNGIQDKDGIIEQTGYGFVTINAQPVFMPNIKDVNKSTMHGEIGRAVELTVKVYSIPMYKSVTWFRGINKELQIIPSQKYSLSETSAIVKGLFYDKEIDLDGFILTLKVNNLTTDDFTTYIIQLDNNIISPAEYAVTLKLSGNSGNHQDSSIPAVVGSIFGSLALIIVGSVIIIALRKTGCNLKKKPDSKPKAESDIHFYQNQQFATRENREPKYEGLNLKPDCQDQHTTYDSLNSHQSAVMHNGINNESKMGGGKSKFNIDESHGQYVNQGGDYLNVM
ncbi:uncharacterized protein LOC134684618 [Mytilus trossulus]|uniref:uncharacterized protein LOC134684618 n=1 Tax=Mytilus trossulus TaxID=6551 RepID=UPI00300749FB